MAGFTDVYLLHGDELDVTHIAHDRKPGDPPGTARLFDHPDGGIVYVPTGSRWRYRVASFDVYAGIELDAHRWRRLPRLFRWLLA